MAIKTRFSPCLFFWGLIVFAQSPISPAQTESSIVTPIESSAPTSGSDRAIVFGHVLSPTNYTLKKRDVTVGNLFAGVGINDKITLGTSPWMIGSYNMHNALLRYQLFRNEDWAFGQQLGYFKTFQTSSSTLGYDMEALSAWNTFSFFVNPSFSFHANLNVMYFFDETIPFSLRQEPERNHPYQVSSTILLESRITSRWGLLAEFGIMGLDYARPNAHGGSSIFYRHGHWYAQMGYSLTQIRAQHPSNLLRPQGERDVAVHPEIALQATF